MFQHVMKEAGRLRALFSRMSWWGAFALRSLPMLRNAALQQAMELINPGGKVSLVGLIVTSIL